MSWWALVGAMVAAAAPIFGAVCGAGAWYVRSTVRQEIARANAAQLLAINGTYVRSALSTMTGAEGVVATA